MRKIYVIVLLFSSFVYSQNEDALIEKYANTFEEANQFVLKNENEVEKSIIYFEELISKSKDIYLSNALQLHKALEERRINPKKALKTLEEVQLYLKNNPGYKQLLLFYNTGSYNKMLWFHAGLNLGPPYSDAQVQWSSPSTHLPALIIN